MSKKLNQIHNTKAPDYDWTRSKEPKKVVEITPQQKDEAEEAIAYVRKDKTRRMIVSALDFGKQLQEDFLIENVMLGITRKGLTNKVRRCLYHVKNAIDTASLYDAIYEISQIPESEFDPDILTADRLLAFRNKIEDFLGLKLAKSYDE